MRRNLTASEMKDRKHRAKKAQQLRHGGKILIGKGWTGSTARLVTRPEDTFQWILIKLGREISYEEFVRRMNEAFGDT